MVPLKAAKETLAKTHHALSTHTSVVPQMAREWTRQQMKLTASGGILDIIHSIEDFFWFAVFFCRL